MPSSRTETKYRTVDLNTTGELKYMFISLVYYYYLYFMWISLMLK